MLIAEPPQVAHTQHSDADASARGATHFATTSDALQNAGQSLWLYGVGRELNKNGRLPMYIADYSVSGLICDLTIDRRATSRYASYAAGTIHAICEQALLAFAAKGTVPRVVLTGDCSEADQALARICKSGLKLDGLAPKLLAEEKALRVQSWTQALHSVESSLRCELPQRQRGYNRAAWN